jgi:hypothetical protein
MKRKNALAFLAVLLVATVSPAILTMHFAPAMAHSGLVLSAWTWNPPTIDGVIDEDEWSMAAKVNFTMEGFLFNGTLYVMNDYENLYLAAKITDDDFGTNESTADAFVFVFDNDNDFTGFEVGDDILFCWSISNRPFDAFFNETGEPNDDSVHGGTQDGFSKASGDGTYNYFECWHPLNSSDDEHDFSLKLGDIVGFIVVYIDNNVVSGVWPDPDDPWHDIKIAVPFYQGDLVLSGNQVYTITGEFIINRSIIVTENATLILREAYLNFTQTNHNQFNITLKNAKDGNPRIIVDNATINAGNHWYFLNIELYENSTAQINGLKQENSLIQLVLRDYSFANVTNSDFLKISSYDLSYLDLACSRMGSLEVGSQSNVNVTSTEVQRLYASGNSKAKMQDSSITNVLEIYSSTRQTLIDSVKPDTVAYWNYLQNCSVIVDGGFAPNITLCNVYVGNWSFSFGNSQHTIIYSSELYELRLSGSSSASIFKTYIVTVELYGSSRLNATDSKAHDAILRGNSIIWSVNSSAEASTEIYEQAAIYVNWYLDVYVKDSIGQYVPDAQVTVTCADGTLTAHGQTNMSGVVRLTVLSSIINATGEYPQGPHNITAVYQIYENSTTINVDRNMQVTVILPDFIVAEFPYTLTLMVVLVSASTAAALCKDKNARKRR